MTNIVQPPFLPVFGTGAPGGSVPTTAVYYDTATSPYTPYIFHSGAWHSFGGGAGGSNATQLQGVNIDATPPVNGQVLAYNGTAWIPTNSGAATPTITQSGASAGASIQSITLGATPTAGAILVALFSHFGNNVTPNNPAAGLGWANLNQVNGVSKDGYAIFYKIAGPGESATQTPLSATNTGGLCIWEIAGAAGQLFDVSGGQHDLSASNTATQNITTTGSNELILVMCVNTVAATLASSTGGGFVSDQTATGGSRAINAGHVLAAAAGTFSPTFTYAGATTVATAYLAIF